MRDEPDDTPGYRLRDGLGYRISRAARVVQARLEADLAQHGLTRMKWCILSGVGLEGCVTPSELAEHIGVARPVISRLLNAMTAEGLIARRLSDEDGRGRRIDLTALGAAKLSACRPLVDRNQAHFQNKLSARQQQQLDEILALLMTGEAGPLDTL